MAACPQVLATISIDAFESDGRPGRSLTPDHRPMARKLDQSSWYSFVMADDQVDEIKVGETVTVAISFANPDGARLDFPLGRKTVFGNGITARGSVVLKRWLDRENDHAD